MRKAHLSWPEAAVILLLVTLLASVLALFTQAMQAKEIALKRAEQDAGLLVEFSRVAHEHYSRNIVSYLESESDSGLHPPRVDPMMRRLAKDFSRRLSDHFSALNTDIRFRIYSLDTSNNTIGSGLDIFEQDALAALQDGGESRFVRTEWPEHGGAVVRLAHPIIIEETCVSCHVSPVWGGAETSWDLGDIVGVREVAVAVPRRDLSPPAALWSFFVLIVVACLLGFGVLYPALRRAARQRSHFEGISLVLGERAKRLARQANTDALTELSNRRFFDNILHAYVDEYVESRTHLGLILFDIDHFKSVNDVHGHAVGDEVIACIARLTKEHVRRNDCPARVGGEEFAILCPGGNRDSLMELAGRLRRLVATQQFKSGSGAARFGVTISLGVAELETGDDPDTLYKRADKHMYRAKSLGRNQVNG